MLWLLCSPVSRFVLQEIREFRLVTMCIMFLICVQVYLLGRNPQNHYFSIIDPLQSWTGSSCHYASFPGSILILPSKLFFRQEHFWVIGLNACYINLCKEWKNDCKFTIARTRDGVTVLLVYSKERDTVVDCDHCVEAINTQLVSLIDAISCAFPNFEGKNCSGIVVFSIKWGYIVLCQMQWRCILYCVKFNGAAYCIVSNKCCFLLLHENGAVFGICWPKNLF